MYLVLSIKDKDNNSYTSVDETNTKVMFELYDLDTDKISYYQSCLSKEQLKKCIGYFKGKIFVVDLFDYKLMKLLKHKSSTNADLGYIYSSLGLNPDYNMRDIIFAGSPYYALASNYMVDGFVHINTMMRYIRYYFNNPYYMKIIGNELHVYTKFLSTEKIHIFIIKDKAAFTKLWVMGV